MKIRSIAFTSAAALSLLPFSGSASAEGAPTGSAHSSSRTTAPPRVQAPTRTQAKPGSMTCHNAGCVDLLVDACFNAGGFSFVDPILDEEGKETGAAYVDCL